MLSAETIAIIKATIPALQAHGETLTKHFYRRMFNGNPEVRAFFNPAHQHSGSQQRALAAAICAYAQHIENPATLAGAVELIAQKHASLSVRAEHYPIVGEHLLGSIKEVLGDAATDAVIAAWAQAYGVLADILIRREQEIYYLHERDHGWTGTKPFVVRRKERESDSITSFYLEPADGAKLRPFQPGQYVTVRVPGTWHPTTMRNYSLSGSPTAPYYRISVKREVAPSGRSLLARAGHVSNYLHDHVEEGNRLELGPPCGEFTLAPPSSDKPAVPLVFISGGVGITPMLSMLHAAVHRDEDRTIWFIHGAVDSSNHAFGAEVRLLATGCPRLRVHVRYDVRTPTDIHANRCDSEGLIDSALIRDLVATPAAEFYFCGPTAMMAGLYHGLTEWGVNGDRMHFEFFGPAESLQPSSKVSAAAANATAAATATTRRAS